MFVAPRQNTTDTESSYSESLLIAKTGKPYSIGENVNPALTVKANIFFSREKHAIK